MKEVEAYYVMNSFYLLSIPRIEEIIPGAVSPVMRLTLGTSPHSLVGEIG